MRSVYGLSCCSHEASHDVKSAPPSKSKQELKPHFLLDVKKKGHLFTQIVGGEYKNAVSTHVLIYCPVHKTEETPIIRISTYLPV